MRLPKSGMFILPYGTETEGGKFEIKAVIFDLGGTLSRSAAWSEYRNAARKMAEICGVPIDDFIESGFRSLAVWEQALFQAIVIMSDISVNN